MHWEAVTTNIGYAPVNVISGLGLLYFNNLVLIWSTLEFKNQNMLCR